jgi:hypothetical protein
VKQTFIALFVGFALLLQGCGALLPTVLPIVFSVAVFYGQTVLDSAVGKTIEVAFDRLFQKTPSAEPLRIAIDPKDHNKATAQKMVLQRDKPSCTVELTNVVLRWDPVRSAWSPDVVEIEKFKKTCAVSADVSGGQ